jgi:hypothetical protein
MSIIKADEDLYMEWVDSADGPALVGTRTEMLDRLMWRPRMRAERDPSPFAAEQLDLDTKRVNWTLDNAATGKGWVYLGRYWLPAEHVAEFARAIKNRNDSNERHMTELQAVRHLVDDCEVSDV